ncbi:TIGR04076 family protein [Caproicibacterium sp. BJN0003]|uniref:TIGR04076 family protein n=1 Tax=Caproicibacterium sp. BJN0003 TaxID=2994078 RepID=UPI002B1CD9C9|nr:TIGR04076 family protein [Caproicibacterium sp. BJN0003]
MDQVNLDSCVTKLLDHYMHTAFPYVDILRYGGNVPNSEDYGKIAFCCPDADVINVFEIDVISN